MNKILLTIPVLAIVLFFYAFISPGNTTEDNSTDEIDSSILLAELKGAEGAPVELGDDLPPIIGPQVKLFFREKTLYIGGHYNGQETLYPRADNKTTSSVRSTFV